MLRFLSIKRFAVIESVEVQFEPGLNVLTGETGAGKSILVEAVGLLLGGRASADLVRTGEAAAAIEAIFDTGSEEVIVRREITAQGRSRAFVDDELATTGALRTLSARQVELHGQHEHQMLLEPSSPLHVVDAFAGLEQLAASSASAFDRLKACGDDLAEWRRAIVDRAANEEWATFQLEELERASLRPAEDEELESARHVLAQADRIQRLCADAYGALYESDQAVLSALGSIWRRVTELAAIEPRFQPYVDAREGIKSQLEDLADFLRRYAEGVDAAPARLQQVEDRLALIERLKRKHGPSLADVVARRDVLRRELTDLRHDGERGSRLERAYADARDAYIQAAGTLSAMRVRAAADFERRLVALLADLALEQTRFEARFADQLPESSWGRLGMDHLEFFISPNPGEELRPLARIVSGGELSRIMLAIKTLMASSRLGSGEDRERAGGVVAPALIFDEVDAGIGGRVADVVGGNLRRLGSAFQVLCITHLPQIAAYADAHFHIEKRVEQGRTMTGVRRLTYDERVDELSRMLAGAVSESTRATAREMLAGRQAAGTAGRTGRAAGAKAKGESERAKDSRRRYS